MIHIHIKRNVNNFLIKHIIILNGYENESITKNYISLYKTYIFEAEIFEHKDDNKLLKKYKKFIACFIRFMLFF